LWRPWATAQFAPSPLNPALALTTTTGPHMRMHTLAEDRPAYTDYLAQSISWYSLDRSKHARTPASSHNASVCSKNIYNTPPRMRQPSHE